ncbi:MAG: substrate-binding domain-containing protein, partial [Pseudomonadota bacterium]
QENLFERMACGETIEGARQNISEAIAADPDIREYLIFGGEGPIGAAEVIQSEGRAGDISVVGAFSPGQEKKMVRDWLIVGGYIWDPKEAGRVFVTLGQMLTEGTELTNGIDIEGLGALNWDFTAHKLISDKLIEVNAETVDGLAARGL